MKTLVSWVAIAVILSGLSFGQTGYKVLWSFGGAGVGDGSQPLGKLIADKNGNLYGTTSSGGTTAPPNCVPAGCGTVFELSSSPDGTWTENVIYTFCSNYSGFSCLDGSTPLAGLVFDSAGNLFGTTSAGGGPCPAGEIGCGTVFKLSPTNHPGVAWTETVLYSFCLNESSECPDGGVPYAKLAFDASGNLYGTTIGGGSKGGGTVFELSPSMSNWTETVLYNFCSLGDPPAPCPDGYAPESGVTFDEVGNIYGTTLAGGSKKFLGGGVVYRLSPSQQGWAETILYAFTNSQTGSAPRGGVNFGKTGNLYGTTASGGLNTMGGVFQLSPKSPKEITFSFAGNNGAGPFAGVLIDPRNDSLYGTTAYGGTNDSGVVFKIAGKKENVLYSFTGGTDGAQPSTALIADRSGNLYGTTKTGGSSNNGVVFEITQK
jgi:uncharacterized repeat protein (TIGR03803 family)